MLTELYWLSVAISGGLTLLNNKAANDTIRRNGYNINNSKASFLEKINYFLTDYFFLFVPFYNLHRSIIKDRIKTKPSEYANKRMNMLSARNLLEQITYEKINEEKNKVDIERPIVKKEPAVKKEPVVKREISLSKRSNLAPKSKEEEIMQCRKVLKTLINEYNEAEENRSLPYAKRKALYDKIINYQSHIAELKKQLNNEKRIDSLKKDRDELSEIISSEKKLNLNK